MASAGAIRAGKAFIELFADTSKLSAGLRRASADIKRWGASISSLGNKFSALGAGITAPILAAAKSLSHLQDDAAKFGIRVDPKAAANAKALVDIVGQLKVGMTLFIAKHIGTFAKIAAGALAAGIAFKVLGLTISAVGAVMGLVASGPLGLLIAALGAGSAAFLFMTEQGQELRGRLGGVFEEMAKDAGIAAVAIKAALRNGDIESAISVMAALFKVEWFRVIKEVEQEWLTFWHSAKSMAHEMNPANMSGPFDILKPAEGEGLRQDLANEREAKARERQSQIDLALSNMKKKAADVIANSGFKSIEDALLQAVPNGNLDQLMAARDDIKGIRGALTPVDTKAWGDIFNGAKDMVAAASTTKAGSAISEFFGGIGDLASGAAGKAGGIFGNGIDWLDEQINGGSKGGGGFTRGIFGGMMAGQALGGGDAVLKAQTAIKANTAKIADNTAKIAKKLPQRMGA